MDFSIFEQSTVIASSPKYVSIWDLGHATKINSELRARYEFSFSEFDIFQDAKFHKENKNVFFFTTLEGYLGM